METSKVNFTLKGFSQILESRVFEFEGLTANSGRVVFTVSIDLALARKYGIRLQELPLLCKGILDQAGEFEEKRTFIYTEADMSEHAHSLALREEAAKHRKTPRPPAADRPHGTWGMPPRI